MVVIRQDWQSLAGVALLNITEACPYELTVFTLPNREPETFTGSGFCHFLSKAF